MSTISRGGSGSSASTFTVTGLLTAGTLAITGLATLVATTGFTAQSAIIAPSFTATSTKPFKAGQANATTTIYIGTADGCQAQIFSVSSSAPTYSPTSTSLCN